MVDPDVFDRRLARLEAVLRNLRGLSDLKLADLQREAALQAQLERWLYVAAEYCLALAHHLISDRGWATPKTYREAFSTLEAEGVIDADLSQRLQGWAGLRNVLAHLYMDIDYARLHDVLMKDLGELETFAVAISRHVQGD